MDELLADILESCLLRIDAGSSVDDCLATYPQQRDMLEAPLHTAAQIRMLPRPALPAITRAALETQMLTLAAHRRAAAPASNGHSPRAILRGAPDPAAWLAGLLRALGYHGPLARPWLRLAAAAIALVLALALGTGALAAARAIVRAIQRPASTPSTSLPAATPFTLDGPIEQIAPERWVINGIAVALDAQTTIAGAPQVGAIAHVGGSVQADAALIARSITIDAQPPVATSAPAPSTQSPNSAPTAIPMPPADGAPDQENSDQDGSNESGKPDKPGKPDNPGKPDKPDKPGKPDKPDKPGKPGKGKG